MKGPPNIQHLIYIILNGVSAIAADFAIKANKTEDAKFKTNVLL
jgi:hypothetical protein